MVYSWDKLLDLGMVTVEEGVFQYYSINSSSQYALYIDDSVKEFARYAFSGNRDSLYKVSIPGSVTTIGVSLFSNCRNLNTVIIEEGVQRIGYKAFASCSKLTNVTIPESVTEIDATAFEGTAWLNNMIENNELVIINNVLLSGRNAIGNIEIPDTVTCISDKAFIGAIGVTGITISENITSIGNYAFLACRGLTDISIPDSVKTIGESAFSYCEGLTEVVIPNSVTNIGSEAFAHCTGLSKITLSDNLECLSDNVIEGCDNLNCIIYKGVEYNNSPEVIWTINHINKKGQKPIGNPDVIDVISCSALSLAEGIEKKDNEDGSVTLDFTGTTYKGARWNFVDENGELLKNGLDLSDYSYVVVEGVNQEGLIQDDNDYMHDLNAQFLDAIERADHGGPLEIDTQKHFGFSLMFEFSLKAKYSSVAGFEIHSLGDGNSKKLGPITIKSIKIYKSKEVYESIIADTGL